MQRTPAPGRWPADVQLGDIVPGDRFIMSITNIPLALRPQATATDLKNGAEQSYFAKLRQHAQSYRLRRRQALPVTTPDSVFIVRSGLVAAENAALPSHRTMVELLYPGDIIAASLLPLTPGLSYTTMSVTELWRVPSAAMKSEMANDPAFAEAVFQRLNMQRARMQLHITMLAGLPSDQRVAALLLQAASRLGTNTGGAISFDMPLSRNEVAEYLALNADTLSRIMSRLVREGILARSSRAQITIRNVEALKAHCPLSASVLALHTET